MTSRRAFLLGLGAALAAPAIIRTPGLLMPVRKLAAPQMDYLDLGNGAGLQYEKLTEQTLLEVIESVWAPIPLDRVRAQLMAEAERIAFNIMRYGSADFPAILPADAV